MSGSGGIARQLAAVLVSIVAMFFLLMAASLPSQLREQAKQDRAYYEQFHRAAAYAANYAHGHKGRMPSDEELQKLGDTSDAGAIWGSLTTSGADCDSFKKAPADQFTLWFWRGEWGECFAYPSGKTTLSLSSSAYFRSGLWVDWAAYWLIGITTAYLAVRLWRRRRPR